MRSPRQAVGALARRVYPGAVLRREQLRRWAWRRVPAGWRRPVEVVDGFDSWHYLGLLVEDVSAALAGRAIEHLVIPQDGAGRPRVVVRHSQRRDVSAALADDQRTRRCWLALCRHDLTGRAAPLPRRWLPQRATGVVVTRNLVTPAGVPLVDAELGVAIDFWREAGGEDRTPGGGRVVPGTLQGAVPNGVIDHAGPELWAAIQANSHRLPPARPHLFAVSEPVDLVYTWVDGDDPRWRARKSAALAGTEADHHSADAVLDARFESRDELRYSLRSVEMYANWVGRIWVVTDGQVPTWLRQDDRLSVVDHSAIFADSSALPVFNSHAIETQLHHIPGLANLYLYLNDDMLFGAPVRPEDFFHSNGITKFFTSRALIDVGERTGDDIAVTAAAKNNRSLLEADFGRTITSKLRHGPQPQRRDLLEQFENAHPGLVDTVMRSRFRSTLDHSLPSSLSQYYGFAKGTAVTGALRHGYVDLAAPGAATTLALWSRRRSFDCLCVNDSGGTSPDAARTAAALQLFFETCYPVPSRWELTPEPASGTAREAGRAAAGRAADARL